MFCVRFGFFYESLGPELSEKSIFLDQLPGVRYQYEEKVGGLGGE